jgi:arylamine N-acetyltransferase
MGITLVLFQEYLLLEERKPLSGWREQYRFKLRLVNLSDFEDMCQYHQTSPESTFTRNRVYSKARPGETLTDTHILSKQLMAKARKALKR